MNRETRNVEGEVRKQFERLDQETNPTIFIGFSGGLDSLALLVALVRVVGDRHKLICLHADPVGFLESSCGAYLNLWLNCKRYAHPAEANWRLGRPLALLFWGALGAALRPLGDLLEALGQLCGDYGRFIVVQ